MGTRTFTASFLEEFWRSKTLLTELEFCLIPKREVREQDVFIQNGTVLITQVSEQSGLRVTLRAIWGLVGWLVAAM